MSAADETPAENGHEAAEQLRGRLFTRLDVLAFALEMEADHALRSGDDAEADRLQHQRLGVRLAQRLVAGVHADEVDLRVQRAEPAFMARQDGFA